MKIARLASITAVVLLTGTYVPSRLAGKEHQECKGGHHRYKVIDVGTLDGTVSTFFGLVQIVNDRGMAQGIADTSIPNPSYGTESPFVFINYPGFQDPFLLRSFEWQDGKLTDLGALTPDGATTPTWISAAGLIVGASTNGALDPIGGVQEVSAVLWRRGQILNLGTLGGNESEAYGVNDRGQVVGWALNTTPDSLSICGVSLSCGVSFGTQARAFLWHDGAMRDLGTLGGADSLAFDINKRGQVAGQSFTNSTPNQSTGLPTLNPFLWEDGKMKDLGSLGGTLSFVNIMNDRGQVVGQSNLAGDKTAHPFLWDGRMLKDLGTLGGNFGSAIWVNEAGEAVGWATLKGDQSNHAFLWKEGVMNDLGTVEGNPCSIANGISENRQIVGQSVQNCGCPNCGSALGWIWDNGGPVVDLNTLLLPDANVHVNEALNINERGEIAANGLLANGDLRAILLIPCDERHPDIDGCDYDPVMTTATTRTAHPAASDTMTPGYYTPTANPWIRRGGVPRR